MAKSVAHQRRVITYPSQKYFKMLNAYAEAHEVSKSEVLADALKAYFDALNPRKAKHP